MSDVERFLERALPTIDIGSHMEPDKEEILAELREKAVEINLICDRILRLDNLTGADYQRFKNVSESIHLQARRILNFAWKKVRDSG